MIIITTKMLKFFKKCCYTKTQNSGIDYTLTSEMQREKELDTLYMDM